jgi:hypothetical protein
MENNKLNLSRLFITLAIIGNVIFFLWVTLNGIKEHFQGTIYEKLSYIGLTGLLILNSILLVRYFKRLK